MTKTGSVGKRTFQKGGKRGEKNTNEVLLPSTRGGLLVRKLEEDEDKMADMTGFWIKFQTAGGSQLINCFALAVEEDAWERRVRNRQEEENERMEKAKLEAFMKMKLNGHQLKSHSNQQDGSIPMRL